MSGRAALAVVLAAVWLSGCATVRPGLGFDDVRDSVEERAGMRVVWDRGSPEDGEARAAVRSLLAEELTADTAVQVALLNNRSLRATYEELEIAQADLVQAGLLRNPVFSAEARFATGGGTILAMDLSQDFLSVLFVPLRKGRAEAEFERAKLRVTSEVLDLGAATRSAFLGVQASEQLVEMRRSVVEATGLSYDLALRMRAAGNNRELDVANERALHAAARLDLARAEAGLLQRREVLSGLMGVWGADTGWRVSGRLPPVPGEGPDLESVESRAVERSLALEIARREIEIAARTLGIVRPMGIVKELDAGVAAEREIDGSWSVGPTVSLPVPLFDQGQASTSRARAELRRAAERYVAEAVTVRTRARAAALAVRAAQDRAEFVASTVLPLRSQILDQTQLQYNAMQVSAFQLLQAKRDEIDAGSEYIGSLLEYWLARARLEHVLSGGDPGAAAETAGMGGGESAGGSRRGEGH